MSGASGLSEGEREALAKALHDQGCRNVNHRHCWNGIDRPSWEYDAQRLEPTILAILAAREAAWRGERDGLRARVEAVVRELATDYNDADNEPHWVLSGQTFAGALIWAMRDVFGDGFMAREPASDAAERPSAASDASGGVDSPAGESQAPRYARGIQRMTDPYRGTDHPEWKVEKLAMPIPESDEQRETRESLAEPLAQVNRVAAEALDRAFNRRTEPEQDAYAWPRSEEQR